MASEISLLCLQMDIEIYKIHLYIYMKFAPLLEAPDLFLRKYWKFSMNTAEFSLGLDWKEVWKPSNFCNICSNSGQVPAQNFIAV